MRQLRPNGNLKPHQELDPTEQCTVGRDPRKMTHGELEALGHRKEPLLPVIRRNCMQCVGGSEAEVRRCAMVWCPFWPYRMNSNPFAAGQSEERRAASAERMRALAARRLGNAVQ